MSFIIRERILHNVPKKKPRTLKILFALFIVTTIGLLGRDGGEIGKRVDLALTVPSPDTPRIQETHLFIMHILCDLVEKDLFQS